MEKASYLKVASMVVFAIGLFFLISSKINMTGAVIGISSISSTASLILGTTYFIISVILFTTARYEEKQKRIYDKIATRIY